MKKTSTRGGRRPGAGRPPKRAPIIEVERFPGSTTLDHIHRIILPVVRKALSKAKLPSHIIDNANFLLRAVRYPEYMNAVTVSNGRMCFWLDLARHTHTPGKMRRERLHTLRVIDKRLTVHEVTQDALYFAHLFAQDHEAFVRALSIISSTLHKLDERPKTRLIRLAAHITPEKLHLPATDIAQRLDALHQGAIDSAIRRKLDQATIAALRLEKKRDSDDVTIEMIHKAKKMVRASMV